MNNQYITPVIFHNRQHNIREDNRNRMSLLGIQSLAMECNFMISCSRSIILHHILARTIT